MAQIIKHRRGSLESVSSATKRAGELLVVTGSAGITATNSGSLLFIGIDGSTATPANKILQGTSVPNLSGANYDTSIDGIPYYDTSAQKLYILNKGGNVEIKTTANTGGTGIVSGSTQITALLPAGTVSGSSQITISSTTGYTTFSSSLDSRIVTNTSNITELFGTASDHETRIDTIELSIGGGGSLGTRVTNLETFSGSQETKNSTLATYTASVNADLTALHAYTASTTADLTNLHTYTASVNADLTNLHTYTASIDSKFTTLGTYTSSIDTKFSTLSTYTASVNADLTNLHTYTASVNADLTALHAYTASVTADLTNLHTYTSSLKAAITASGADVTFSGNVTIPGNLTVAGTQTIVNSTTVQIGDNIIELNGSAAANGGLLVKDATNPNTVSGSLLWDSTNDYWKAGASGSESKLLRAGGDGVVSGSSQITISSTTGYSTFSSSLATNDTELFATASDHEGRIDVIEASLGGGGSIGTRVTALEAFTSSQESKNSSLATYTGSIDTKFSTLSTYTASVNANLSALQSFTASQETKNSTLSTYTASVDTNLTALNSFSSSINTTIKTKLNTDGVISGSSQLTASYDSRYLTIGGDSVISGSSQLDNTTINGLTLTSVVASGSFSGSFVGDGSGLTGIASTLAFSGSTGNDTINLKTESLLVTGSTGVSTAVTNNTITISGVDASTSAKGVASFSSTNFAVASGNVTIKAGGVTATTLAAGVAGTGISLNGVDNSIEVDYGSTAGTAVEGNTSLTIQGTSNEIEITNGSVTLGNGGTVTIGLPNSVTIPTASIQNNLSVGGNVNITGNLYVQGTTTTIDSTTISLGDNIIELNGSAAANGGLIVKDVTAPNTVSGSLLWDTTNDYWKGGALGSEKQFARLNATPTSGSVQVIGANGLLVDSTISDDAVKVTIGTDLVINGLTANSFVVANSSKKLISVTPSNDGDMIQWNGSSFVASNTIDGGTF